jgi:hypothetical protein
MAAVAVAGVHVEKATGKEIKLILKNSRGAVESLLDKLEEKLS